jgi:hypothetical protein
MYKKAIRKKLRFNSPKGVLNLEQVWSLKLSDLKVMIQELHSQLNKNKHSELDFLEEDTIEGVLSELNSDEKLCFDILVDVYKTKRAEVNASKEEQEKKAYNKRIDEIIAQKQEEHLHSLSIAELEKLRK